MPLARLHVVRVEEKRILRIERLVLGHIRREHERLEEPAGVREVPLRGTDVGHRADDVVLRLEWIAEVLGVRSYRCIALTERSGGGNRGSGSHLSVQSPAEAESSVFLPRAGCAVPRIVMAAIPLPTAQSAAQMNI